MRAVLLLGVTACGAWGAAPPATLTAGQKKTLGGRDRLRDAALKAWQAGKEAEALAALRDVLEIERGLFGPWHDDTAGTLARLGDWRMKRDEWAEEAVCRRLVLEARSRLNGPEHHRAIDARLALASALARPKRTPAQQEALLRGVALHREAWSWQEKGQPAKGLPAAREALALCKEVLGTRHPDHAIVLSTLASLLRDVGDAKAALPLVEQALAVRKGGLGTRHPRYADSLDDLASLHSDLGAIATALPLAREALGVRRGVLGAWHPDYAVSLNNLANLRSALGEHAAAIDLYKEALALTKDAVGDRGHAYVTGLNNLALAYRADGDLVAARPLLREALALRKGLVGDRHPEYALGLNNLALLLKDIGDHGAALALYREALAVYKEAVGVKHPLYASSLNNLALLLRDTGDFKAALPLLEEALKSYKGVLGVRHPLYATALDNLAATLGRMGRPEAALPLYKEALKVRKEVLGAKHPHYAMSLNNLALLLHGKGDNVGALPMLKEALAINRAVHGARHHACVVPMSNLAFVYLDLGDHGAALPQFEGALRLTKEALGTRHPTYAQALSNLASLRHRVDGPEAALPLASEALSIMEGRLRELASVQSDRQQLAAAVILRGFLNARMLLPDEPGGPGDVSPPGSKRASPTAAAHALAWKGAVTLRQQERRLFLRLTANAETRAAAARLQDATRRLAALRGKASPTRAKLEELQREQEGAQSDLARLSAVFREGRAKGRPTPETLAAALPDGAVLVDYLFHGTGLTAFVYRKDKKAVRVPLGKARPAGDALNAWRGALLRRRAGRAEALVVKRLIWLPLEKHVEGAKVVLISPDGVLGSVPLAALPGRRPGTYLVEDLNLAVVPVPAALLELLATKEGRHGVSLLVVGGVEYDAKAPGEARAGGAAPPPGSRGPWADLPGTGDEAGSVTSSFKGLFRSAPVTDLRKARATKAAVREALPKVRYAHLATHGFFTPEGVRPALSADDTTPASGGRGEVTGWHPLLLSGLAFAGANHAPKDGEEDGILTALEVSEWDLSKLELAVLSACETGLGQVSGGEGILGLQRAFQVAGARSVVSSLWQVSDEATRALMGRFYGNLWGKKMGKLEALAEAQRWMLREGHTVPGVMRGKVAELLPEEGTRRLPPYYWAAFVLSGDWR